MDMTTGDTLKNGAVIHAMTTQPNGTAIVLAHSSGRAAPWVTWAVDTEGEAYWGHYYSRITEALADYNKRTGA